MSSERFTRKQVSRLAALSRTYREAEGEINAAIVQEMGREADPEWRADVGERFGLSEEEFAGYQPEEIKRLRDGFIHRAGLHGFDEVLEEVLRAMRAGALKPGAQFPPRDTFTDRYRCDKRTHASLVKHLTDLGLVHRPGGEGGPLYVAGGLPAEGGGET